MNKSPTFSGRSSGIFILFVSILLVQLAGCRQEPVEEAHQLITATLQEGEPGLRQRNRVDVMRITYAVNAQGSRAEDVAFVNKLNALQQSTAAVWAYLEQLQGAVLSVSKAKPDSRLMVQAYLTGNGPDGSRGKLYSLYELLRNYRKPLADVLGQDVPLGTVFPPGSRATNHSPDPLRAFLEPFRDVTATEALALLAAYKTRILFLQARANEYAGSLVGVSTTRDNRISLLANPARDSVKTGSIYEADLYLTVGLENWTLYKTVIDGKMADPFRPWTTLTAARGKDGKPQRWEAQLYLFDRYDKDTVLTIRRPFPLHESDSFDVLQKP